MKKGGKPKTRRVTIVIPESTYQLLKQITIIKNKSKNLAKEQLSTVSDIMREALIRGIMAWKEIDKEASRRLKMRAKREIKHLKKGHP